MRPQCGKTYLIGGHRTATSNPRNNGSINAFPTSTATRRGLFGVALTWLELRDIRGITCGSKCRAMITRKQRPSDRNASLQTLSAVPQGNSSSWLSIATGTTVLSMNEYTVYNVYPSRECISLPERSQAVDSICVRKCMTFAPGT